MVQNIFLYNKWIISCDLTCDKEIFQKKKKIKTHNFKEIVISELVLGSLIKHCLYKYMFAAYGSKYFPFEDDS